jgi:hypothetical protein
MLTLTENRVQGNKGGRSAAPAPEQSAIQANSSFYMPKASDVTFHVSSASISLQNPNFSPDYISIILSMIPTEFGAFPPKVVATGGHGNVLSMYRPVADRKCAQTPDRTTPCSVPGSRMVVRIRHEGYHGNWRPPSKAWLCSPVCQRGTELKADLVGN